MAETQAAHRQYLERTVIESDKWQSLIGLILAFVLASILGIGGIYLIGIGRSIDGLVAMLTPLGILVGCFLYAERQRRKERSNNYDKNRSQQAAEQLPLQFD